MKNFNIVHIYIFFACFFIMCERHIAADVTKESANHPLVCTAKAYVWEPISWDNPSERFPCIVTHNIVRINV